MRQVLLLSCFFIYFSSPAQNTEHHFDSAHQKKDSQVDVVKSPSDTNHYARIEFQHNDENIKRLMQQIKDRENQERQLSYVRIALGAAFLVVLVIGLTRKRRKRNF